MTRDSTRILRSTGLNIPVEDLEFIHRLIRLGVLTEDQFVELVREYRDRGGVDICELLVSSGYLPRRAKPSGAPSRPRRFGKFVLQGTLGFGGMGRVVRAWDEELHRAVAIKFVGPNSGETSEMMRSLTADQRASLLKEARAAAKLAHPNVVKVFEVGELDGEQFIVLEYVEGASLKEFLAAMWRVPATGREIVRRRLPKLLERLRDLAGGLDYAHEAGVLHRDIKPGNILVEFHGHEPVEAVPEIKTMKLADFGLAIDLDQENDNLPGTVIGTLGYMSPEQTRGRGFRWMPASDVFSMGVVLYETATGRSPFARESDRATLRATRLEEPPPPSKVNPDIDPRLDTLILACLEKEPWNRYPRASALADAIAAYLDGQPVDAPNVIIHRGPRLRSVPVSHATAFYNRALARQKRGDLGGALADYSKALDEDPLHLKAWLNRGSVLFALGDLESAILDWTKSIELDSKCAEGHLNRALALRQMRKFDEAIAEYDHALELGGDAWMHRAAALKSREKARAMRDAATAS